MSDVFDRAKTRVEGVMRATRSTARELANAPA
jgi:hypothetical protein